MELLKVKKLNEAQQILHNEFMKSGFNLQTEKIDIKNSLNRIIANDIKANDNVPSFRRSTVDGYAVKSVDVSGASESVPCFLTVIGESVMGQNCGYEINAGECVYVPTGAMLPKGSDAVVMVEWIENFSDNKIAVYKSVASSENVVNIGDDNKINELLLKKGRRITSSDIGLLASNAIKEVIVYKTFDITIISTGDEIIDINEVKKDGEIYDINSWTIYAECKKNLFNIKKMFLLKDERNLIYETIKQAMSISDIVVISGGSSKGKKDNTANVINDLCSSGVIVHGIAVKPGKPTIIGCDENTKCAVIGLPGHPVATVFLFNLLVVELYARMTGSENLFQKIKVKGRMSENIVQSPGRTTFQLVTLDENNNVRLLLGKSGLINTLSKSDGYIVIDENCEGKNVGEIVDVYLGNI